jgi:hypothetical protein
MNGPNAHAHPPREGLGGARSLDELDVSPVPSLHGTDLHVAQEGWPSSTRAYACDSPLDAQWPIAFAAIARDAAVDNVRVHTQPDGQLVNAPLLSPEFLLARMPCENLANLRVGEFSRRTAPKTHDDSREVCRRNACTLGSPASDRATIKDRRRPLGVASAPGALVLERRPRMRERGCSGPTGGSPLAHGHRPSEGSAPRRNALLENLEPNEPGKVGPTSQNYCHLINWGDCFCDVWDGETCLSCLNADAIEEAGLVWEEDYGERKGAELPH